MKKIILLLLLASPAKSAWIGRFDLLSIPTPVILRELHDGQWLAGVSRENLWHLDYVSSDPNSPWNGQRFHIGVYEAWNAEHGNASTGLIAGFDLPAKVATALSLAMPSFWKAGAYASAAISIDGFGGYRPIHSADVNGPWVYGIGAKLKVAFGTDELKRGL